MDKRRLLNSLILFFGFFLFGNFVKAYDETGQEKNLTVAINSTKEALQRIVDCEKKDCYCNSDESKCDLYINPPSGFHNVDSQKCGCSSSSSGTSSSNAGSTAITEEQAQNIINGSNTSSSSSSSSSNTSSNSGSGSGNVSASNKSYVSPDSFDVCAEAGIVKTFQVLGWVLFILKIVAPLALIVIGGVTLGKAVISSDEKAIQAATTSLIKKAVAGIVIFFIPTIVGAVISLVDQAKDAVDDFSCLQGCITSPGNSSKCTVPESELFNNTTN